MEPQSGGYLGTARSVGNRELGECLQVAGARGFDQWRATERIQSLEANKVAESLTSTVQLVSSEVLEGYFRSGRKV